MSYTNVRALLCLRDPVVREHGHRTARNGSAHCRWLLALLLVQNILGCKVYDDTLFAESQPCGDAGCKGDRGGPDASSVASGPDSAGTASKDACPTDARKSEPGACGCGKTEHDADEDGTPDCLDACPRDDSKTAPGVCGCGTSEADSDSDGTPDCLDGCPHDPIRTTEASCSCNALDCVKSLLRHRYRFNGEATLSQDSVGMADATLFQTGQTGRSLRFSGEKGQGYQGESYAELPSRVWDVSSSMTLEVWISWAPSGNADRDQWQRVIDVARSGGTEHNYYFYLTPFGRGGVSAGMRLGGREVNVNAPTAAPSGAAVQLACVLDKHANTMALYVEGSLQGTTQLPAQLDTLKPDQIWLGRSHFANDPELRGELFELRVWGAALNEQQLKASAEYGPNHMLSP